MSKILIDVNVSTQEIVNELMDILDNRVKKAHAVKLIYSTCNDVIKSLSDKEGKPYNKTITKEFHKALEKIIPGVIVEYYYSYIIIKHESIGYDVEYKLTVNRVFNQEIILSRNLNDTERTSKFSEECGQYNDLDVVECKVRNNVKNMQYHLSELGKAIDQMSIDANIIEYAYAFKDKIKERTSRNSVYLSSYANRRNN